MNIIIEIPEDNYNELLHHLLPEKLLQEESAFVFATPIVSGTEDVIFTFLEVLKPTDADYAIKSSYHIELTDDFKKLLIAKARQLDAAVIEFHSHTGNYSACFSSSDWEGFADFVPHVFWRTGKKYYAAVVVTKKDFDGLAWIGDSQTALPIEGIRINDNQLLRPTNHSLQKNCYANK